MWDLPELGMLTRAFHLHLVGIRIYKGASELFKPFRTTLDEEFVARLIRTHKNFYVISNSNELAVCGLSPVDETAYVMNPRRRPNIDDVSIYAEAYAGVAHRELFTQSIKLVVSDTNEGAWLKAEAEAETLAAKVLQRLSVPDSVLALEHPLAYSARLQRQITYSHWGENPSLSSVAAARHQRRLRGYCIRVLSATMYVLRGLGITRAVRLLVFPLLSPEQEQYVVTKLSNLGNLGPRRSISPLRKVYMLLRRFKERFWFFR